MLELAIFLASSLAPGAHQAVPLTPAALAGLLDSRRDAASTREVIETLERASADAAGDDLAVRQALLRARQWLGERHPPADEAFERNLRDGLDLLGARIGRRLADAEALEDALPGVTAAEAGVLLWTALSYGRTIEDLPWYARAGAASRFVAMLERVRALDPTVAHGSADRALAEFREKAPGVFGGDDAQGLREARRAVEIEPRFAANHLAVARLSIEMDAPRSEIVAALEAALALPEDALAGWAPEQRRARERAKRLLDGLD